MLASSTVVRGKNSSNLRMVVSFHMTLTGFLNHNAGIFTLHSSCLISGMVLIWHAPDKCAYEDRDISDAWILIVRAF